MAKGGVGIHDTGSAVAADEAFLYLLEHIVPSRGRHTQGSASLWFVVKPSPDGREQLVHEGTGIGLSRGREVAVDRGQ